MGNADCTNFDTEIFLIAREKDFIVVDKPADLASAPLYENEKTAFSQIVELAPETALVRGKKTTEGGLVHRLDTATRGLLLAACTQSAFDNFDLQQKEGRFIKYYCAYCRKSDCASGTGQKPFDIKTPFIIESRFRAYGKGRKKVKPVFDASGKADLKKAGKKIYRTEIVSIRESKTPDGLPALQVFCKISSGYRHQVRAHLASCGLPVMGDSLYNPLCNLKRESGNKNGRVSAEQKLLFTACALDFDHPVNGRRLRFVLEGFEPPCFT